MDHHALRCTVPVEICGKICEFGLRPDRYYSRVPVEIWRLFKTTLRPLPSAESVTGDDLSGCLGLCSADLSVLNRNLNDKTVLVSREPIPTIGLSTLADAQLVYNFGDGTVKLADDYTRHESPRQMLHSPFNVNDDLRRLPDARGGSLQYEDEVYERRRAYERDDEFWEERNMRNSLDRRPNQSIDEELYVRRNQERPDFDDSRRLYSPPANYRPNYPDDEPTAYRRNRGDAPDPRLEFDLQPFDEVQQRPQFNDNLRPDSDMNFQENRMFEQERRERLKRDAAALEYNLVEQGVAQQLNVMKQQTNFNALSAFDSTALREAIDNSQLKRKNEQRAGKKKKVPGTYRCSHCKGYGHGAAECWDLKRTGKQKKAPKKFFTIRCDKCHKFGHTAPTCMGGKNNANASQSQANKPGGVQPWVNNAVPNVQTIEERVKIFQIFGGKPWPNV